MQQFTKSIALILGLPIRMSHQNVDVYYQIKLHSFCVVKGSFVIGHQYCAFHTETINTLISSFQCLQTFIREMGGVLIRPM